VAKTAIMGLEAVAILSVVVSGATEAAAASSPPVAAEGRSGERKPTKQQVETAEAIAKASVLATTLRVEASLAVSGYPW
jgi:hypothetical protein